MPAPRPRAQQPDRLLRYTFDSHAQARKHLHVCEGRQLLFFPDPFLDVRDGDPILLEFRFLNSEQTLVVRGDVHSLETGAMRGAWLELHGSRLLEGMQVACGTPRRAHRRLPADVFIRAEQPGHLGSVARLADVSPGGARVVAAGGRWTAGEQIQIVELTGGGPLLGTVIRVREGDLAVQFQRDDVTTRRGAMRLVESAVRRWAGARESRHPAACGCQRGGALYEPLRPRAVHRKAEGL